jgi:hypothetical protein
VTKEEKEKLDEWYVRNASLWVDLQIIMMTIKVILKSRVSSEEILADTEQVRSRNVALERTNTALSRLAAEGYRSAGNQHQARVPY